MAELFPKCLPLIFTIFIITALSQEVRNDNDIDQLLQEIFGPPQKDNIQNIMGEEKSKENISISEPPLNFNLEEQTGNTNSVVGICKCISNDLCNIDAFVRMRNPEVCLMPNDVICCTFESNILCTTDSIQELIEPEYALLMNEDESYTENRKPVCGQRNYNGISNTSTHTTTLINQAKFGEFPWMVVILLESTLNDSETVHAFQCGGSLINPNAVLTAAHCVDTLWYDTALVVRVGEWNVESNNVQSLHEDYYVLKVEIHPEYNRDTRFNDIAILILDMPVILNSFISTICLPHLNFMETYHSTNCILTGWGKQNRISSYSTILKQLQLSLIPGEECLTTLMKTVGGSSGEKLHDSFLCANNHEEGNFCDGDDGSPLVCERNGSYYQVGVAAWHYNCGVNGAPALFVNVAKFYPWIDNILSNLKGTMFVNF